MAENTILGRVQLKYDTLANWNSSTFTLKRGEVAIAEIPSGTANSGLTPPAMGIKVGDGSHRFSELPWIQAVAGDVYAWAKGVNKPSYAASEITGLDTYITTVAGDGKEYRLVKGITSTDLNTYYLEHKGSGDSTWTRDTTYTINLESMDTRLSTLENWADTQYSLATQINTLISSALATLNLSDSAVSHQFVTQVTQTNGKIAVSRSTLGADDITSGTLGVQRGGTGLSTIPANSVIVGNGTSTPTTKSVATSIGSDNDVLVTAGGIKNYVTNAVAGIANAMHFIGFTTDELSEEFIGAPTITGKTYTTPVAGDVVISGNSEWVYTGSGWQELGTEGDYAVKGSITKSDLANALKSEIEGKLDSSTASSTYVAKNGTDRLMTAAEGTKLAGIETGAEVNVIESITLNGVAQTITDKNVALTIDLSSAGQVNGARVPNTTGDGYESVTLDVSTKNLELARMAKTGDVADLVQTSGTVLVLNCGSATTVIN